MMTHFYKNAPDLPPSSTNIWINLAGVLISSLFVFNVFGILDMFLGDNTQTFPVTLFLIASAAAPLILLEWRRLDKKGLLLHQASKQNPFCINRFLTKYLGVIFSYVLMMGCYLIFEEYRQPTYTTYNTLLGYIFPIISLLSLPYIYYVDRYQTDPYDSYWQIGALLSGRWKTLKTSLLKTYARDWLVKTFFLPLMFAFTLNNVNYALTYDWSSSPDFMILFKFLLNYVFLIDVLIGGIGYFVCSRALDTHIRSTDHTLLGWFVAIMCYPPFWSEIFFSKYLNYQDNFEWSDWLIHAEFIQIVWGSFILILISIYTLSTVAFGLKFSNLTYRGLISCGPYKFCKHPAYVTKCLSWWMISIPFITHGHWLLAVQNSVLLFIVCLIYFMRARTEERHLSQYPEYVQYALAMNQRSIFASLANILPFLKYKSPPSDGKTHLF